MTLIIEYYVYGSGKRYKKTLFFFFDGAYTVKRFDFQENGQRCWLMVLVDFFLQLSKRFCVNPSTSAYVYVCPQECLPGIFQRHTSKSAFICSKLTIETPEQGVKYVKS